MKKQILFTKMFNQGVFSSYNDMGYYYLSNKHNINNSLHRNIVPKTKEEL